MIAKIIISFIFVVIVFYIITTPGKLDIIKYRFRIVARTKIPVIKERIKNWFLRMRENRLKRQNP